MPGQFFDERIINERIGVDSAADLWQWVTRGASSPLHGSSKSLPNGPTVVYRGQSNSEYSLSSSLYRLCKQASSETPVKEAHLATAESEIIKAMRAEGLGRRMTDGELLMVLQHHGIPTRLVDVSVTPLEALFFAVDQNESADVRLFIIELHDHAQRTALRSDQSLPWANATRGTQQSIGSWSATVDLVDEDPLDPRMRAQNGKFLAGGLTRRYAGRRLTIKDVDVPPSDYPEITTLGIHFGPKGARRNNSWPATGWSVLVEAAWKTSLLDKLQGYEDSIRPDTMYPPLSEVRRLAISVARQALAALPTE